MTLQASGLARPLPMLCDPGGPPQCKPQIFLRSLQALPAPHPALPKEGSCFACRKDTRGHPSQAAFIEHADNPWTTAFTAPRWTPPSVAAA